MNLFLSYATQDHHYKDEIKKTLSKLERDGKIKLWVDEKNLRAGDFFDESIEKAIQSSDMFLLLLSRDFWASDYIQTYELPLILELSKNKKLPIIPIVLYDNYDLEGYSELNDINGLPRDISGNKRLKPIVDFRPEHRAYNVIQAELIKIIDSLDKDILPLIQLSKESLKTLNPYINLEKIELKSISHQTNSYSLEIIEHYEDKSKRVRLLSFDNENRERIITEFQNIRLFVKIKNRLSEQKTISRYEILNYMGVTQETLFPVSSQIKTVEHIIETEDIRALIKIIDSAFTKKLLVYGSAGVGKTTTLSSLKSYFSDGLVIIYDSFGGGTYKDFGSQRHLQERILIQIINELAIELGLELVHDKFQISNLELKLTQYLKKASDTYRDNKVIIIIDAGDNNVEGANYFKEEPYIPKLWTLNLPSNCYLIMSARGGIRKDLLGATNEVEELALRGFDLEASTQFLLQSFSNIGEAEALQFHQKTQGNPRIENYLLEEIAGDYEKFQAILLGDEQISLEDIFEDMWQQALSVIQPSTKEHLEELICLSRPARLDNYILASGLEEQEALKTIQTLESGVSLDEQNMIRFQDEDFENFIHTKIDEVSSIQAHRRIAYNLLPVIDSDIFATKKIAFHLDKANKYQELMEITFESTLSHISDRLDRKEIEKDRVDRALAKALEICDYKSILRLLFIQAEITKSDDALNDFLKDYPELLAIYTDEENAVNYYLNKLELGGTFYYDCAYLLVKSDPKKAISFLKLGDASLIETLEGDYHKKDLDKASLAKRGVVLYYLRGIEKTIYIFNMWHYDLTFIIEIISNFPKTFLLDISIDKQKYIYRKFKKVMHPFIQAQLLISLNSVGNRPLKEIVFDVTKQLYEYGEKYPEEFQKLKQRNPFNNRAKSNIITIDFSILALSYGIESRFILPLLENALIEENATLRFKQDIQNFDDKLFKIVTLSEIKQDFSSIETLRKRYEGKETINGILPYYQLYVQTLLYQKSFEDIKVDWIKLLNNSISHWYHNQHFMIVVQRYKLLNKILIISNANRAIFDEFVENIKRNINRYNVIYFVTPILLYGGYLDEAFELIDLEIDRIRKEPDSLGEKVDNFITFAEMVRAYDKDRARCYFELALEATNGLDNRFYDLYKLTTSLTQSSLAILTKDEKIELINKNIHIVESVKPYLYETHGTIVNMSIKLIAQLDFSLALEVAHRWDNHVLEKFEDSLVEILPIAIINQELSIDELFVLRFMIKKALIIDSFLPILDAFKTDKAKLFQTLEKMILFVRKNLSDDAQYILENIEDWLKDNGFTQHHITLELSTINNFYKSIKPLDYPQPTHKIVTKEPIFDWDNFFEPYIENLPKNLKKMETLIRTRDQYNDLFDEIRKRLDNNQKMEWLKELCKLNGFHIQKYVDELLFCFDKWKYDSEIQENRDSLIRQTIAKHSSTQWANLDYLKAFSCYIPSQEIAQLLLKNRLKIISYMDTREIYNLMNKIHKIIDKEDTKEIVFDFIAKIEKHFEPIGFRLSKQYDNQTTLVNLLWKLLGHPDRRERWKARHTVRELLNENHQYIPWFIDKLFTTDGFPFTDDMSFYTISARESLLIVFHRLSYEIEEILKPYISKFETILLDEEFPHIIIREIVKSIIFNLADEIDNSWLWANKPKSCWVENQTYGYGFNHKTRFYFDSTDTIPYWYNDMQNIFNFEMITLLEKAENWIIDKWGQNDTVGFKDGYWGDYYLTSHRHGELPIIEEPKRHLEFEAMFLVIGEFIQNNSVNKGFYANDRYQEFLDDYFEINDFWCSEWRDIKPLEPFVYGVFNKDKEMKRYDELLGLGGSKLCLDATYDIYTEGFSETISIASTLVLPETSDELHKLLEKANHFDYCFPYIDNIHNCQDYKGYDFTAWIEEEYIEKIHDKYDPYIDNFSTTIHFPSSQFIQYFHLEENKYKNSYKKANKEIVKIERWADEDRSNDYEYIVSKRDRMWFDFDTILSYLNYRNMDMLIEVRIASRQKEGYKEEYSYNKKTVIYCLKLNGEVSKVEKEVER